MPPAVDQPYRPWLGYARARGVVRVTAGWTILSAGMCLIGELVLHLPSWPGIAPPVQAHMVLPVFFGLWAASTLHSRMADLEHHAARRMRYWDTAYATTAVAISAATPWLITMTTLGTPQAVIAARNSLMWGGLALIAARFLGQQRMWLTVLLATTATLVTGWNTHSTARPWALPLHLSSSSTAAAAAFMCLAVGLACTVSADKRRT
ncbi:hypothetical protein OG728_00460 [Streptomyces microflavus]|uniref:hypothetical protein n=1 Tax=Streptomyces microflavus TaxID=1919 RepID=UPI002E0DD21B|nr:hypothetical protein OG728_00460 [Streptomyces microflavus]